MGMSKNLKKRVTIKDVALLSGVSISTVSRVINHYPFINEEKRIRVEQAIKELGFQEGVIAKVLHRSENQGIGILIGPESGEATSMMVEGVLRVASLRKTEVRFFFASENEVSNGLNLHTIQRINSSGIAGLVVFDRIKFTNDTFIILNNNQPILFVNRPQKEAFGGNTIRFNFDKVIDEYLIDNLDKSDKDIYLCDFYNNDDMISLVRESFLKYPSFQKRVQEIRINSNFDAAFGYFSEYLQTHQNAIYIVPNDKVASSLIRAANFSHLDIPNNLEIISVIGSMVARVVNPTISNINIDFNNLGVKILDMFNDISSLKQKDSIIDCYYVKRLSSLD